MRSWGARGGGSIPSFSGHDLYLTIFILFHTINVAWPIQEVAPNLHSFVKALGMKRAGMKGTALAMLITYIIKLSVKTSVAPIKTMFFTPVFVFISFSLSL